VRNVADYEEKKEWLKYEKFHEPMPKLLQHSVTAGTVDTQLGTFWSKLDEEKKGESLGRVDIRNE
jgi:hypothetical protein